MSETRYPPGYIPLTIHSLSPSTLANGNSSKSSGREGSRQGQKKRNTKSSGNKGQRPKSRKKPSGDVPEEA